MIYSMTGYGRGMATAEGRKITVEIKSLNSKQLDLMMKMHSRYHELEAELRNRLMEALERGKVEVVVSIEAIGKEGMARFNLEALKAYKAQIEKIDDALGINHPHDWHAVLLRLPDVMRGDDNVLSESEKEAFFEAANAAIDNINKFRMQEGGKLETFFIEKIENIRKLLSEVEPHEASRIAKIKSRMQDQLEKISSVDYDKGRLEQELIYYIEKLDISEEKQRLCAHLDYYLQTLAERHQIGEQSRGKKLGFISQEMGREINTLGSKSNNAEMQIIVVKMKDELEQIKEQVLNVL